MIIGKWRAASLTFSTIFYIATIISFALLNVRYLILRTTYEKCVHTGGPLILNSKSSLQSQTNDNHQDNNNNQDNNAAELNDDSLFNTDGIFAAASHNQKKKGSLEALSELDNWKILNRLKSII